MEGEGKRKRMEKDEYLNMTPHPIHVFDSSGTKEVHIFLASGYVLRLKSKKQVKLVAPEILRDFGVEVYTKQEFDGIEISGVDEADIPGFLAKYNNIIVSMPCAEYMVKSSIAIWRTIHLYIPDSGPEGGVRGKNGEIVGTKRLIDFTTL